MNDFQWKIFSPEIDQSNEIECIALLSAFPSVTIHLRKPYYTIEATRNYLDALDAAVLNKVVIHQHHELINEYSIKGIHLKSNDSQNPNKTQAISTSIHSMDDVLVKGPQFEYVFLSPIFDSISKRNYSKAFSTEELKQLLEQIKSQPIQLMALGGVDVATVKICKSLGFHGAGLLGALWLSSNPVDSFEKIVQASSL